jgi:hypothetical protein
MIATPPMPKIRITNAHGSQSSQCPLCTGICFFAAGSRRNNMRFLRGENTHRATVSNVNVLLSGSPLQTSTSAIDHEAVIDKPTPVILKSQFLPVLCEELVAEIPSSRSAPCHYVAILHRQRVLTVRASGWRAADKILGVDHHIAPFGQKPTTVLVQSDTRATRGCQ